MRGRLVFCILLWATAVPALALPRTVLLEMRRDVISDGVVSRGTPQQLKVVLAADYLEFVDQDGRVVHDFVSRQSHLVQGDDYLRRSLYSDVGFRVAELNNRVALLHALREKEPERLLGEEVAVEHLLGLDDELTEANISRGEGTTLTYSHNGRLLAEFARQGHALTADQSKAFVRFLRYYCGGHPDILSEVQVRAVLPERYRIVVRNLNEEISYDMRLLEVTEGPPVRPDFAALRPTVLPPEPIGTLVALGLQLHPQAARQAREALLVRAEQALTEQATFTAALLYFEVFLMEGGNPPAPLASQRETFEADPDTKKLFDALLQGGQAPRQAASQLQALEDRVPSEAHVLKIFRAGMLLAVGENLKARDLYLQALVANPAIAGAWKDLGDIYHANYETDLAWLCWDVGRRLAPEHQMLRAVTRLEESLRSNYPGFF
jgi:tetratricopeptide (TPR) repeat protein